MTHHWRALERRKNHDRKLEPEQETIAIGLIRKKSHQCLGGYVRDTGSCKPLLNRFDSGLVAKLITLVMWQPGGSMAMIVDLEKERLAMNFLSVVSPPQSI